MQINVVVQLDRDQALKLTPSELALKVLEDCEGDPTIDYCTAQVFAPVEPGSAGTPPEPPPPAGQMPE